MVSGSPLSPLFLASRAWLVTLVLVPASDQVAHRMHLTTTPFGLRVRFSNVAYSSKNASCFSVSWISLSFISMSLCFIVVNTSRSLLHYKKIVFWWHIKKLSLKVKKCHKKYKRGVTTSFICFSRTWKCVGSTLTIKVLVNIFRLLRHILFTKNVISLNFGLLPTLFNTCH